jgi:hypothetical protein
LSDESPITAMVEAGPSRANINSTRFVHVEEFQYIDEAIAREREIKGWRRSKKDALVQAANPAWADLADPGAAKSAPLRTGCRGCLDCPRE